MDDDILIQMNSFIIRQNKIHLSSLRSKIEAIERETARLEKEVEARKQQFKEMEESSGDQNQVHE